MTVPGLKLVIQKEPPEYKDIFQYLIKNYEDPGKGTEMEKFWVNDLEEGQYPRLEGPVSEEKVHFGSPEEAARTIEEFAIAAGADMIGFTEVTDEIIFKGATVNGKYAISIGFQMNIEAISKAPGPPTGIEALRAYWRLGSIILKVSQFIRSMGYQAQGHQVRTFIKDPPTVLNSLAAVNAGLGEVGRLGLLITRRFGPRVRLGTITTELELPDNGERPFGVDEFCSHCTICADECVGEAIPMEKSLERGHMKYTIDPYKCLTEFAKYDGCGVCISVCPFNRPENEMEWFLEGVRKMVKGYP